MNLNTDFIINNDVIAEIPYLISQLKRTEILKQIINIDYNNTIKYTKQYKNKNIIEIKDIISKEFPEMTVTMITSYNFILYDLTKFLYIYVQETSTGTNIDLIFSYNNNKISIDESKNIIEKIQKLGDITNEETIIKVYYDAVDKVSEIETRILNNLTYYNEAYPTINEGLDEYISKFKNSIGSLLILKSEPGTGKTQLLRKIMFEFKNKNIVYVCQSDIIEKKFHYLYAEYLAGNIDLLIIEDADSIIENRQNNIKTSISTLLNMTDGIFGKGLKVVITTNIFDKKNIDNALLRPGRLFEIKELRKLTYQESCNFFKISNNENLISKLEKQDYTLASLYALINGEDINIDNNRKIGFK